MMETVEVDIVDIAIATRKAKPNLIPNDIFDTLQANRRSLGYYPGRVIFSDVIVRSKPENDRERGSVAENKPIDPRTKMPQVDQRQTADNFHFAASRLRTPYSKRSKNSVKSRPTARTHMYDMTRNCSQMMSHMMSTYKPSPKYAHNPSQSVQRIVNHSGLPDTVRLANNPELKGYRTPSINHSKLLESGIRSFKKPPQVRIARRDSSIPNNSSNVVPDAEDFIEQPFLSTPSSSVPSSTFPSASAEKDFMDTFMKSLQESRLPEGDDIQQSLFGRSREPASPLQTESLSSSPSVNLYHSQSSDDDDDVGARYLDRNTIVVEKSVEMEFVRYVPAFSAPDDSSFEMPSPSVADTDSRYITCSEIGNDSEDSEPSPPIKRSKPSKVLNTSTGSGYDASSDVADETSSSIGE